jgi:hypothetical protein
MSQVSDAVLLRCGLEAADICGCLWDDVEGETIVDKLRAVLATPQCGGDADLTSADRSRLRKLLAEIGG